MLPIAYKKPLFTGTSRVKRQATATYGGIEGLPLTYGVTLPSSCCTSDASFTSNTSSSCKSRHVITSLDVYEKNDFLFIL